MKEDFKIAESVRFKKYIIRFSVYLMLALTCAFIISSLLQETLYKLLSSDNAIIIENSQIIGESRDFTYHIKKSGEDIKDEFTAQVLKSDIEALDETYVTIFTPLIQSEAFEMYINGKNIAVEGDIASYNSTIWTQHYCYTVESSLFDKEINELKIIQYGRYMSGGLGYTFIIDGYRQSIFIKNSETLDIHEAIYGTAIFTFVLIILMITLFREKRKYYFLMLFTMLFMMIGYLEYFEISHLGFEFLVFKKIIVVSNLLSVCFGTLLFRRIFNKTKHSLLIILCYTAAILIPTLFAQDMPTFKTIYTILTFAIVPIIFYWIYLSIRHLKQYPKSKTLLALSGTSIVYTIIWNLSEITKFAYMDSVTVVIMPVFIIAALTLILIDMHDLKIDVAASNKKYTSAYKKSIIDGLTKLYNAAYMKEIATNTNTPFAFVVYDIDDFKHINDTYGHVAGDEVLIGISEIVKEMLRSGDFLSRYGGDEFILLLRLSSIETLESVLERLRQKIEKHSFNIEGKTIRLTVSIGYCIVYEKEEYKCMLQKADKALYQAKKVGKNTIVAYSESEYS